MYEVIHYFTDLQDFSHPYNVGDIFPRNGMKVSESRLKELSGSNNKQHKPLIRKVEEETVDEPIPFSDFDIIPEKKPNKTEINRMTAAELREMAIDNGVADAKNMKGTELKQCLIRMFGL